MIIHVIDTLSVSLNLHCWIHHLLLSDLLFSQWQDNLRSWDFFNCFLAVLLRATVFSINILTNLLRRRKWECVFKCCSAQTCMRTQFHLICASWSEYLISLLRSNLSHFIYWDRFQVELNHSYHVHQILFNNVLWCDLISLKNIF